MLDSLDTYWVTANGIRLELAVDSICPLDYGDLFLPEESEETGVYFTASVDLLEPHFIAASEWMADHLVGVVCVEDTGVTEAVMLRINMYNIGGMNEAFIVRGEMRSHDLPLTDIWN